MQKLTIYSDGAARGNPGNAASAWLILDGTDVLESNSRALGRTTNNVAEYTALISALKAACRFCVPEKTEIECFSDSEVMVSQLTGKYACRAENLVPLYTTVRELERVFAGVSYKHVPRENGYVSACDWLCNQTLDLETAAKPAAKPEPEIRCTPVGFVRSPFKSIDEAPNMGALTDLSSTIEIKEEYRAGLKGVEPGDYIFVLCWFDRADRDVLQVHPRRDKTRPFKGVFATRSPARPNPVSLTLVKIEKIEGLTLTVKGLEALDNTPVLDIKPYSEMDSPSMDS